MIDMNHQLVYLKTRTTIGDLPVGAGVAVATPDKERNLSTRNQNVINKELFGKRSGKNKYFFK